MTDEELIAVLADAIIQLKAGNYEGAIAGVREAALAMDLPVLDHIRPPGWYGEVQEWLDERYTSPALARARDQIQKRMQEHVMTQALRMFRSQFSDPDFPPKLAGVKHDPKT